MRKKQVLIIGDNGEFPDKNIIAFEIGKFVAANGWVLITGGKAGIMRAASQGASENNGLVVAILPSDCMDEANSYAQIVIPTGIGFARNYINALACDVVIAIGGGSGTLCEMAYAWHANKPIISCSFTEGWSKELAGKVLDYRRSEPIIEAKSVQQACDYLKKILAS